MFPASSHARALSTFRPSPGLRRTESELVNCSMGTKALQGTSESCIETARDASVTRRFTVTSLAFVKVAPSAMTSATTGGTVSRTMESLAGREIWPRGSRKSA
jgi:hypothetical protein